MKDKYEYRIEGNREELEELLNFIKDVPIEKIGIENTPNSESIIELRVKNNIGKSHKKIIPLYKNIILKFPKKDESEFEYLSCDDEHVELRYNEKMIFLYYSPNNK